MSSLSFHDKQHVLRLLNQQGQVKRIFDDFTRRSGLILTKWTEKNTDNVWIRNTTLENQIDKLLEELHDNLLININNNTTGAWEASNLKNDDLLKAFIKDLALPEIIGKSRYEKLEQGMFARNMDALKAFQQRRIDGLTLSDTVWKSVEGAKENLEYYLSSGISTGRPAASISQDIRQLLQDPDKRFRRVKNDEGKLIMSQPMKAYEPGQGRYRSSYKNALRVAATETNQAYHTADYERWSNQGFVLGIEVHRSKSNKGPCAICDPMVGKYPPGYKFKGQHPWCICFAVPIMLEGEEYIDYLLTGVVPEDKIIKTVPQSAIDFVNAKEANKNQWFVKENSQYFGTQEAPSKKNEFIPSKTIEEAMTKAKSLGINKVDFGNAELDDVNTVLSALHDEKMNTSSINLDKLIFSDGSKMQNKTAFAEYEPKSDRTTSGIYINTKQFKSNDYSRLVPWEEQLSVAKGRIINSEDVISKMQSRLGINKKTDNFLKQEIKREKKVISDIKFRIMDIEDSIKKGEQPIRFGISSSFEDVKQQIKAKIHHEFGHHIDYELGNPGWKNVYQAPSLYGQTNKQEFFAEYYAKYKMMGEKDIPEELINIFKKWEKK
ncbi:hypothetical protein [Dysgonomonas capnocytophagoides]|uniref:hypothetical protein n=1 Tax=Dysgonomonas capnocytophagoides TaxID=45254 RepID=UPI0030C8494C